MRVRRQEVGPTDLCYSQQRMAVVSKPVIERDA
jgi:hypothetical protein